MNKQGKLNGEVRARAMAALSKAIEEKHPDPHTAVAAAMFDLPEAVVTEEQRRIAKLENYFILYDTQPPQLQSFEPWVHIASGNPCTLVARGRHRATLQPFVHYIDRNGVSWFGEDRVFREKFRPMDDYTKNLDLEKAEQRAAAAGDGDAPERNTD